MFNTAKCPNCNRLITSVTFEAHDPSFMKGGSSSFIAVSDSCGHSLGAVPVLWETYIQNIRELNTLQNREIQNLKYQIDEIQNNVRSILQRLR